ncbi:MAG: hypothetical protein DI551_01690 [Micavibrio aeruginosavorus]|uniref:Uncharacterized protein n=1 Tax=Micavibrio aeruginosavorus TaxID=349221 RepID=A0A2W5N489_9BACT|nr:MAG: hypothetical protein DI551_01690 [Micavibrio aeruginosavorus]
MCKFHKDVAREIATNRAGEFDAGKYSTALISMALFRVEQYMPEMHGFDGFQPEKMLTDTARESFAKSNLARPQAAIVSYHNAHIEGLRAAMDLTARSMPLSLGDLNIKDRIEKGGYKATCCAEPDPTENGPFLDEAVVEMFTGYDDTSKKWASGPLSLVEVAHKPEFEALRTAVEHFTSQEGVRHVLQGMFERSVASIFQSAEADLAAGHTRDSQGCAMCRGTQATFAPSV